MAWPIHSTTATSVLRPRAAGERAIGVEGQSADTVRFMLEDGFLTSDEFETIVSDPIFNRYANSKYYRDILRMQYFEEKQEKEIITLLRAKGLRLQRISSTTKTRWLELMAAHPIIARKVRVLKACMNFVPVTHDFRRVVELRCGLAEYAEPMQINEIARTFNREGPFVDARYKKSMLPYIRALVLGDTDAARKILENYAISLRTGKAWTQDEIGQLTQEIETITTRLAQQPARVKPQKLKPQQPKPPQPKPLRPRLVQPKIPPAEPPKPKPAEKPKEEPKPKITVRPEPKPEAPRRSVEDEKKIRTLNAEAKAHLNQKQYDKSIEYADEVLKIDKRNAEAMLTKALCLYNFKIYDECRALLKTVLDVEPNNRIAALQLQSMERPASRVSTAVPVAPKVGPEMSQGRSLDVHMRELETAVDRENLYEVRRLLGIVSSKLEDKFHGRLHHDHAQIMNQAQAFLAKIERQRERQGGI